MRRLFLAALLCLICPALGETPEGADWPPGLEGALRRAEGLEIHSLHPVKPETSKHVTDALFWGYRDLGYARLPQEQAQPLVEALLTAATARTEDERADDQVLPLYGLSAGGFDLVINQQAHTLDILSDGRYLAKLAVADNVFPFLAQAVERLGLPWHGWHHTGGLCRTSSGVSLSPPADSHIELDRRGDWLTVRNGKVVALPLGPWKFPLDICISVPMFSPPRPKYSETFLYIRRDRACAFLASQLPDLQLQVGFGPANRVHFDGPEDMVQKARELCRAIDVAKHIEAIVSISDVCDRAGAMRMMDEAMLGFAATDLGWHEAPIPAPVALASSICCTRQASVLVEGIPSRVTVGLLRDGERCVVFKAVVPAAEHRDDEILRVLRLVRF